jgi:hypothetical protein
MFFIYGLIQLFIPFANEFYIFVIQLGLMGKHDSIIFRRYNKEALILNGPCSTKLNHNTGNFCLLKAIK